MSTVFKLWFVRGGDWKTVDLANYTDLQKNNAKYALTTGEKVVVKITKHKANI